MINDFNYSMLLKDGRPVSRHTLWAMQEQVHAVALPSFVGCAPDADSLRRDTPHLTSYP